MLQCKSSYRKREWAGRDEYYLVSERNAAKYEFSRVVGFRRVDEKISDNAQLAICELNKVIWGMYVYK